MNSCAFTAFVYIPKVRPYLNQYSLYLSERTGSREVTQRQNN